MRQLDLIPPTRRPLAVRYLTGASNPAVRAVAHEAGVGLLVTPATGYERQVGAFPFWAADNGCFAQGATFDLGAFLAWLDQLAPHRAACLFAVAPDVVGDMLRTWARSVDALPAIRAAGYPAALVAQNGLDYDEATGALRILRAPAPGWWALEGAEYQRATAGRDWSWSGLVIPWDAFNVLFIGGDDCFKLYSPRAWRVIRAAVAHGKPVHLGRVNSGARLAYAESLGCSTADGTFLAFGPDVNLPRLLSWLAGNVTA